MTPAEHLRRLKQQNKEYLNWFDRGLKTMVGTEAVNFYQESFQNEGFTDNELKPWKEVKRRSNPKRVDRAAAKRPILTGKTGDLGESISYSTEGVKNGVRITADTLKAGSDKDYAKAHNEGTKTAGRGNSTTIPKRQFIGKSKKLNDIIENKMEDKVKRILK